MNLRFVLIVLALLECVSIQGQQFERNYEIPVVVNGTTLANAWAGGLNSCQVSRIDANLDGKKDLFVFDRIGSRISIYLNMNDTQGVIDYKYTLEYNAAFPTNLKNWVLLRDMNCDGKEDICVNSGSGFKIYLNTSEATLSFDQTVNTNITALYDFGDPFTSGIYCIAPDIPAFNDYDNDGDIDIWSWNEFSSSLYYYQNMAFENGTCEVPSFVCRNRCYGMFGESSESFSIFTGLDFQCDFNVVDPREEQSGERMHTGGTTLALDLDQNGLKDLVIGDVTANDLIAVMMGESANLVDSATVVHTAFPLSFGGSAAANMTTFLGSFFEDINNDGVRDLMISPNAIGDAADRKSLVLYLNEGLDDLPDFQFEQDNFLQDGMIDLGVNAYPVLFDYDNDGLIDLFISNRKYFEVGNNFTSRIAYYHNTGTTTAPAFTLEDPNWLDIPSLQWQSVYPAFGDLDGDGDADLLIGDQDGLLHHFINDAPIGQPCHFTLIPTPVITTTGSTLDVGQNATPQIIDLNNDGLNDLVIGELNGNINYYKNNGTIALYSFELVADTVGSVVATNILGIQGKSVPFFFKNNDDKWELLIGTETGQINHYSQIEDNILGTFNLITLNFENINEGERCAVFMADINGDNLRDLFIGNIGGGVGVYTHLPDEVREVKIPGRLGVFPNPANDILNVVLPYEVLLPAQLTLMDFTGRIVFEKALSSRQSTIHFSSMQNGVYVLSVQTPMWFGIQKVIVKR